MGELGLFGLIFPEEYGGSGADFTTQCLAIEEIGRVDQSMGITLSAGVGLGANPIFTFGTDEQKAAWLPDLVRRARPRRLRPHRARRRQRRRRHPHEGAARPGDRRVGDRRLQGVHHQLGHTDHLAGDGHRPHRRSRDLGHRRARRARRGSSSSRPTARWAGTRPTPTASSSTAAGCRPSTSSAAGHGLPPVPRHPRRRPHRHLRARRGPRPGLPGAGRRAGQAAERLRRADRRGTRASPSRWPTWRWPSRTRATSRTRRPG